MAEKRRTSTPHEERDNIDRYLLSPGALRSTQEISTAMQNVPLTLQPFFKDQIDLNSELVRRFPNMPLMSVFRKRELYNNGERQVATLTAQDGAASLIVDISRATFEIQFSFMYGSMLALRFHLDELSDLDRRTWLDNMQTRFDETVFLWGQSRWEKDYIICVPHSYYISILAFSPNHFEAAVRITLQPATVFSHGCAHSGTRKTLTRSRMRRQIAHPIF
jgi:hypothetical protein